MASVDTGTIQENANQMMNELRNEISLAMYNLFQLDGSFNDALVATPVPDDQRLINLDNQIANAGNTVVNQPAPEISTITAAQPTRPGLYSLGALPTLAALPSAPAAITIGDMAMPQAFDLTPPADPGVDSLQVSALNGTPSLPTAPTAPVFSFEDISQITMPVFNVDPLPTYDQATSGIANTFSFTEEDYKSELLDEISERLLLDMVNGGYGINTADEQALWEREREREMLAANTAIEQAASQTAARGFAMPPGAFEAMMEGAQQAALAKISSVNRDIALKRADMYVENRKFTIQQAKELEQMLQTFYGYRMERALKAAQIVSEANFTVYNTMATVYNARVNAYKTGIEAYNARIQAALAPLERDKAVLEITKTKAGVFSTVVQAYQAQVQAAVATMEIDKMKLEQDRLRFDQQRIKLEIYQSQIQGFKARVEANAAQYQGYSTFWEGQKAKVGVFSAMTDAYKTQVDAEVSRYRAQVEGTKTVSDMNRSLVDLYAADAAAYKAMVDGQSATNAAKLDAYKAKLSALAAQISALGESTKAASVLSDNRFKNANAKNEFELAKWKQKSAEFTTTKQMLAQGIFIELKALTETLQGLASQVAGISAEITSA